MFLSSLILKNFRNYKDFNFNFKGGLVILTGLNTSGKTNLLEAIQLLSLSKSFRVNSDQELINWQANFSKIIGDINKNNLKINLDITLENFNSRIQKTIKINSQKSKAINLIGELITVLFCPEDLNLITLPPSSRRKYLNVLICQASKDYCHALAEYKKVVLNRNCLLSQIKAGEVLEPRLQINFWNEKLILLGEKIILERINVLEFFNLILSKIYNEICATKNQTLKLIYKPSFDINNKQSIKEDFKFALNRKSRQEIRYENTLIGPHRDDFVFELNHKKINLFGSRGEYRSAILALKSAEISYIENKTGERPLLLLDDVFSELDEKRRNHLFDLVRQQQTFITTTDFTGLEVGFIREAQVLKIKDGVVINK